MNKSIYVGAGLWVCIGVFLVIRYLILVAQATNNRLLKPGQSLATLFQSSDPKDYNERGQYFLRRAKGAFVLLGLYALTFFILIAYLMR
jgi:hypothetical protein